MKYDSKFRMVKYILAGSVVFGCAAYQAGNILGAISGLGLLFDINTKLLAVAIYVLAVVLLWFGNYKFISNVLGIMVAIMGAIFITVAIKSDVSFANIFVASVTPKIPSGSEWIVLGLIGTTIVPYNLFLGSGIGKGQTLGSMRFGLIFAIIIGGIISIAIIIVGTQVNEKITFIVLSERLTGTLGQWASPALGIGLFAAGFTSSITAPLAAAVTVHSVSGETTKKSNVHQTRAYKFTWVGVLTFGFLLGVTGIKPIPVIILAQAINGLLLPIVAIFLIDVVNDRALLGETKSNGTFSNIILLSIVYITIVIGLNNLLKAGIKATGIDLAPEANVLTYILIIALGITTFIAFKTLKNKRNNSLN